MGHPVIHFEVMGTDGEELRSFYANLFDWAIDADNPLGYGIVKREANVEGVGIGGGIGGMPAGAAGHLTFYVEVPDVEAALAQAEKLGGTRLMGPTEIQPGVELGQFSDPEGHMVGLIRGSE
jgi:predicted enzyme related to lactoylglutathione lyase